MAEVLLVASAEDEEGGLKAVQAAEVLELGNLRVKLLVQEDSPCAL